MQHTDYWTLGNVDNLNHYHDLTSIFNGRIFLFFALTACTNSVLAALIVPRLAYKYLIQQNSDWSELGVHARLLQILEISASFLLRANVLTTIFALTVALSFSESARKLQHEYTAGAAAPNLCQSLQVLPVRVTVLT